MCNDIEEGIAGNVHFSVTSYGCGEYQKLLLPIDFVGKDTVQAMAGKNIRLLVDVFRVKWNLYSMVFSLQNLC